MTLAQTASLAFRNLFRNRARTIATLSAIVASLVGLTLLDGFISYSMDHFRDSIIRGGVGHIELFRSSQAQDEGDSNPIPFLFDNPAALQTGLKTWPEVDDVLPVLSFSAVISDGDKTHSVQVTASPVAQSLKDLTKRKVAAGSDLAADETGRVLLGTGLAKQLKVAPGSTIQLYALAQGGGVNTVSFTVAGTTSSEIKEVDDRSVAMSFADAQDLLDVTSVAKLVVFLKNTADTGPVLQRLAHSGAGSPFAGLKAESWDKLFTAYQYANSTYQLILAVARFVVLTVALFSISGTLTLSVIERYRELGTLRAFGTRRPRLLLLLALEGLFLGAAGALLGTMVGAGLSVAINAAGGLTMPAQPGMSVDTVTILFTPRLDAFGQNGVALLFASIVAALLPGTMSFRRTIAELLKSH
jgi:putative ABC transport system permease protein